MTVQKELIDVRDVSEMLGCSRRTVWRLRDGGRMPAPVRVMRAVRWSRKSIMEWIDAGLPDMRETRRGARR